MTQSIRGRVWKFGDDINTDLMIPSVVIGQPVEMQAKHCFAANRPGWTDLVRPGDIIVGGQNYGTGSSRPAANVLKFLGVSCVLAESINGLFLRNSVNFGFAALSCLGVSQAFDEGDEAEVDLRSGRITNLSRGVVLSTTPLPEQLVAIIEAGGILPVLRQEGYID